MTRLFTIDDVRSGVSRRTGLGKTGTAVLAGGLFAVILAVMLLMQWHARAFDAEFGTLLSDEPAHYINGLLVADYLRHGLLRSPLAFAYAFYLQYPKVTIGHWPPAFYLPEGLWMLLAGASKASMLALSATITAGLAVLLGLVVRRRAGAATGVVAALAFAMVPMVRDTTLSLMIDIWVALLEFAAALLYIRFLNTRRWQPALLFALFAATAILSKGNGIALALLPPLALLATRRFDLLRWPTFWLPALVVAVLCGPWTWLTYKATANGFFYSWGLHYTGEALGRNGGLLLREIGPLGLALAVYALVPLLRVRACPGMPAAERNFRAGMAALFSAVFIFQAIVPASIEPRYMLPALPPLIALIALGFHDLVRWLGTTTAAAGRASVGLLGGLVLLLGLVAPEIVALRQPVLKPLLGMVPAVREIIARLQPGRRTLVLIGGGGESEGSFIAEVAMQDRSRRIVVVRGLSLLAGGNFRGKDYRTRFASATEVADCIDNAAVQFVAIDTSKRSMQWRHMHQLVDAVRHAGWTLIGRYPHGGVDGETLLYRIDRNHGREPDMASLAETVGPRLPF